MKYGTINKYLDEIKYYYNGQIQENVFVEYQMHILSNEWNSLLQEHEFETQLLFLKSVLTKSYGDLDQMKTGILNSTYVMEDEKKSSNVLELFFKRLFGFDLFLFFDQYFNISVNQESKFNHIKNQLIFATLDFIISKKQSEINLTTNVLMSSSSFTLSFFI